METAGTFVIDRLKSKKEIDDLYQNGNTIISDDRKIKIVYKYYKENNVIGLLYTVAVHKKAGTAVWRNRTKRLLREAFRLNKDFLINYCKTNKLYLKIVFSPNIINHNSHPKLKLEDITKSMQSVLTSVTI